MVILCRQYNIGEKSLVILHTYITKPSEHPPQGKKCLKALVGTSAVETNEQVASITATAVFCEAYCTEVLR